MSPAEKAHCTRYYRAARELSAALLECTTEAEVVAAFANLKAALAAVGAHRAPRVNRS